MDLYHTKVKVIKINRARLGLGGKLEAESGNVFSCGCVNGFPQDAKVGDCYRVFVSHGKIIESEKLGNS